MEETLGKRIIYHRKRLGLTQEKLAAQLGVSPQAVSKWENDVSCPDITLLPKLAEIFGISTDELLGRPRSAKEGEVEDREPEGLHMTWDLGDNGDVEVKLSRGRWHGVLFGAFVLTLGVLLLLSSVLKWNVGFWSLLWPCCFMYIGLGALLHRGYLFGTVTTLAGLYFLLVNLHVLSIRLSWELVFAVILVAWGLCVLVRLWRKPKGNKRFAIHGKKESRQYVTKDGRLDCSVNLGSQAYHVDTPRMTGGDVDVSFGSLSLDLTGVEEVAEDCGLDCDVSFGSLELLVPSRFRVHSGGDNFAAAVDITGTPDPNPAGTIRLSLDLCCSAVEIRYV